MKKNNGFILSLIILATMAGCQAGVNSNPTPSDSLDPSTSVVNPTTSGTQVTTATPTTNVTTANNTTTKPSSTVTTNGQTTSTKPTPTGNLYNATIASTAPDYYESARGLKGEALKAELHNIIKQNHKAYSYNSTINDMMKEYDLVYGNSSKLNLIYTGETSKSTAFNKEHVWAKSHGDFGTAAGPGSDLHNLRPCNENLNSTRGNDNFGSTNGQGSLASKGWEGNYSSGGLFEPRDDFKGDVARTIFYMATRYEKTDTYGYDLELSSPSNTSKYYNFSSGASGTHGRFDDLYEWATSGIDPVDNFEVNRNNIIYDKYQKNRNPFVDHPEFIIMIYDKNYNGAGALNDLTGTGGTVEDSVNAVEELIEAIGTVTLDSLSAIEAAEEAYNRLTDEAKAMVDSELYQKLLDARKTYNQLFEAEKPNKVVEMINSIGDVTLEDQNLIEEIEELYNSLTDDQKAKVTNYEVLVAARAKLNELIAAAPKEEVIYQGNWESCTGAPASGYASATLTLSGKTWNISNCYKNGADFRLGSNKVASLESKYLSALGLSSADGSALEMGWDINNAASISFETNGSYGTVNKLYILKSVDGGNTYSLCEEFDYSAANPVYEIKGTMDSSVRYALVITGSKPRLILTSVTIKGAK